MRAEYFQQQRRKKEKRQMQFIKDPYRFTRAPLGQQKYGTLSSLKPEVEEFVWDAHRDPCRS